MKRLTYAQILSDYSAQKKAFPEYYKDWSLDRYAEQMQQQLPDYDWSAAKGADNKVRRAIGHTSRVFEPIGRELLDPVLQTVAGPAADALGVDRQTITDVSAGLPRSMLTLGAGVATGGLGLPLLAGLEGAASAYEQSGELLPAATGGVGGALMPGAASLANKAIAARAARPVGKALSDLVGKKAVASKLEDFATGIATQRAGGEAGRRVGEWAGREAALFTAGLPVEVLTQAARSDVDLGEAFAGTFSREGLFANALGNLAFLPMNVRDAMNDSVTKKTMGIYETEAKQQAEVQRGKARERVGKWAEVRDKNRVAKFVEETKPEYLALPSGEESRMPQSRMNVKGVGFVEEGAMRQGSVENAFKAGESAAARGTDTYTQGKGKSEVEKPIVNLGDAHRKAKQLYPTENEYEQRAAFVMGWKQAQDAKGWKTPIVLDETRALPAANTAEGQARAQAKGQESVQEALGQALQEQNVRRSKVGKATSGKLEDVDSNFLGLSAARKKAQELFPDSPELQEAFLREWSSEVLKVIPENQREQYVWRRMAHFLKNSKGASKSGEKEIAWPLSERQRIDMTTKQAGRTHEGKLSRQEVKLSRKEKAAAEKLRREEVKKAAEEAESKAQVNEFLTALMADVSPEDKVKLQKIVNDGKPPEELGGQGAVKETPPPVPPAEPAPMKGQSDELLGNDIVDTSVVRLPEDGKVTEVPKTHESPADIVQKMPEKAESAKQERKVESEAKLTPGEKLAASDRPDLVDRLLGVAEEFVKTEREVRRQGRLKKIPNRGNFERLRTYSTDTFTRLRNLLVNLGLSSDEIDIVRRYIVDETLADNVVPLRQKIQEYREKMTTSTETRDSLIRAVAEVKELQKNLDAYDEFLRAQLLVPANVLDVAANYNAAVTRMVLLAQKAIGKTMDQNLFLAQTLRAMGFPTKIDSTWMSMELDLIRKAEPDVNVQLDELYVRITGNLVARVEMELAVRLKRDIDALQAENERLSRLYDGELRPTLDKAFEAKTERTVAKQEQRGKEKTQKLFDEIRDEIQPEGSFDEGKVPVKRLSAIEQQRTSDQERQGREHEVSMSDAEKSDLEGSFHRHLEESKGVTMGQTTTPESATGPRRFQPDRPRKYSGKYTLPTLRLMKQQLDLILAAPQVLWDQLKFKGYTSRKGGTETKITTEGSKARQIELLKSRVDMPEGNVSVMEYIVKNLFGLMHNTVAPGGSETHRVVLAKAMEARGLMGLWDAQKQILRWVQPPDPAVVTDGNLPKRPANEVGTISNAIAKLTKNIVNDTVFYDKEFGREYGSLDKPPETQHLLGETVKTVMKAVFRQNGLDGKSADEAATVAQNIAFAFADNPIFTLKQLPESMARVFEAGEFITKLGKAVRKTTSILTRKLTENTIGLFFEATSADPHFDAWVKNLTLAHENWHLSEMQMLDDQRNLRGFSKRLKSAHDNVTAAYEQMSPAQRKLTLKMLFLSMHPQKLDGDKSEIVRNLIETGASSVEEFRATFGGLIVMFNVAAKSKKVNRELINTLSLMSDDLLDYYTAQARSTHVFMKAFNTLLSGVMTPDQLGGLQKALNSMENAIRTPDEVFQARQKFNEMFYKRQENWRAMRYSGRMRQSDVKDAQVQDSVLSRLLGEVPETDTVGVWNRYLGPMAQVARGLTMRGLPKFAEAVDAMMSAPNRFNETLNSIFLDLNADGSVSDLSLLKRTKDGQIILDKDNVMTRHNIKDTKIYNALHELLMEMNTSNKTPDDQVLFDKHTKDLSFDQKNDVRMLAKSMGRGYRRAAGKMVENESRKSVFVGSKFIQTFNNRLTSTELIGISDLAFKVIREKAPPQMVLEQIAQRLKIANPGEAQQAAFEILSWVQKTGAMMDQNTAELKQFFDARPGYSNESRPGRFYIRGYNPKNPKDPGYSNSADSPFQMQRLLNQLKSNPKYKHLEFTHEDRFAKGARRKGLLEDEFYQKYISQENESFKAGLESIKSRLMAQGKDLREFESFVEQLKNVYTPADTAIREQSTKGMKSVMKHREFVPGREHLNPVRQYIDYAHNVSKLISETEMHWKKELLRGSDEAQTNPDWMGFVEQTYENLTRRNSRDFRILSSATVAWRLGWNISSVFIELSQPWHTGVTNMVELGFGVKESYGFLAEAYKDYANVRFGKDGNYSSDPGKTFESRLFARAVNEGLFNFGAYEDVNFTKDIDQLMNKIFGMTGEEISPIEMAGKVTMQALNAINSFYGKISNVNTVITFMAATKGAKARGMSEDAAYTFAREQMRVGAMIGGKHNRPNYANMNSVFALMHTLQQYTLSFYSAYFRYAKNAFGPESPANPHKKHSQKAFMLSTAMQFAAAGLFGIPMVGPVLGALEEMTGFDSETALREWITQAADDPAFGALMGESAAQGLMNTILPIDWASRAGMNQLLGFSDFNGFDPWSLAGPVAGLGKDMVMGWKEIGQGDHARGLIRMAPNAIKKPLELGLNDMQVRTPKGEPLGLNSMEQMMYAIGYTPRRVAQFKAHQRAQSNAEDQADMVRGRVYDKISELVLKGDGVAAMSEIQNYAAENPQLTRSEIINAVAERATSYVTPPDTLRTESKASLGRRGSISQAYGNPVPRGSEQQRLATQDQFRTALGGKPSTFRERRIARRLDALAQQYPTKSRTELLLILNGQLQAEGLPQVQ